MQMFSNGPLAIACAVVALGAFAPRSAFAQGQEGWQVDLAPLYFWAATTDGNLAINGARNVPVYMDFADAKSKLAGAFAFHGEARHGRWGALGDVNFIRLSSDVSYTTPILSAPIAGTVMKSSRALPVRRGPMRWIDGASALMAAGSMPSPSSRYSRRYGAGWPS